MGYLVVTGQMSIDQAATIMAGAGMVYVGATAVEDHGVALAVGQAVAATNVSGPVRGTGDGTAATAKSGAPVETPAPPAS